MTITVLSIVFTYLSEIIGVECWAKFVLVVAVLGGNLSINLRELGGTYLRSLFSAALALFFILLLFLILFTFFAAL